jgi:tetratricopeptide (TPR) repeat protein
MLRASAGNTVSLLLLLALTGAVTGCKGRQSLGTRDRAQGDVLLQAGQFEQAAEHYRLATEANPQDPKAWERRAYALMQAGRMDEAAEALLRTQALVTDVGRQAETLRNVAYVYLRSTTPQKAERYFQEALRLHPDDTESLMWLGEIASERGGARSRSTEAIVEHLEQAIAYYDRVLVLQPDSLLATVNKRIAVMKLIRFNEQQKEAAQRVLAVVRKASTLEETRERAARYDEALAALQSDSTQLGARIQELKRQGHTLQP